MENAVYQEIDLAELEDCLGKEIMINLRNGEQYFGLLKDVDEEELILSRPDSKVSLGFKLEWITNCFVKDETHDS